MIVKIIDGNTQEVISESADLLDVLEDDDEYTEAAIELQKTGRCWLGGGAAPLILLTFISRA